MSRSRNYVYTLNNYTNEEEEQVKSIPGVRFNGFGREVGESGTPHLQGLICFSAARSFTSAKASFPVRTHLELMRGTSDQAWEYCTKDGNIWSSGERPRSSSEVAELNQEKYKGFIEAAKKGEAEDYDPKMYLQYYNTVQRIYQENQVMPDNLNQVCGIWIFGVPGCGKSHAVASAYPSCYRKMANKWWDSYRDEEVVWLDDLDPDSSSWISRYLKIWADKWSFMAEIKGSSRCIRPKKFIVTSNYSIEQMGFRREDLEAIRRRFRVVEKLEGQNIIL